MIKSTKNRKDIFRKNTIRKNIKKNKKMKKVSRKKRMQRVSRKKRMQRVSRKKRMQSGGAFEKSVHDSVTRRYITGNKLWNKDKGDKNHGILTLLANAACVPFLALFIDWRIAAVLIFFSGGAYLKVTGTLCFIARFGLNFVDRVFLFVEYSLRGLCDLGSWGFNYVNDKGRKTVDLNDEENDLPFSKYLKNRKGLSETLEPVLSTIYDKIFERLDREKLDGILRKHKITGDINECKIDEKEKVFRYYFSQYGDNESIINEVFNEMNLEDMLKNPAETPTVEELPNDDNETPEQGLKKPVKKPVKKNSGRVWKFGKKGGTNQETPNPFLLALKQHSDFIFNGLKKNMIEEMKKSSTMSEEELEEEYITTENLWNYIYTHKDTILSDESHLIKMIPYINNWKQLFLFFKDKLIDFIQSLIPSGESSSLPNLERFGTRARDDELTLMGEINYLKKITDKTIKDSDLTQIKEILRKIKTIKDEKQIDDAMVDTIITKIISIEI
jgi:hypothetical protein